LLHCAARVDSSSIANARYSESVNSREMSKGLCRLNNTDAFRFYCCDRYQFNVRVQRGDDPAFSPAFRQIERCNRFLALFCSFRRDRGLPRRDDKVGGGGYYPDMRLLSLTVKPVLANSRSLHGTSSRVSSSPTIITGYHMLYGTIKGIGMAHIRP